MRLVGMCCARNEEWCIGLSLRAMLMFCDSVVVLVHASRDRTLEIVQEISSENKGRVILGTDDSPVWAEMEHREKMLQVARADGATHLWIGDSDEIITGNLLPSANLHTHMSEPNIRAWISIRSNAQQRSEILQLPGYNLRGSLNRYHANGIWGNRWFSTAFKDSPDLGWAGDRFHQREPGPRRLFEYQPIKQGEGGIMHLWGANERRLRAKHRAYRIQERLRWPQKPAAEIERMYSWATDGDPGNAAFGTPDTWTYADVPYSWWRPYESLMAYLDLPQIPWQEAWCDEMIQKYGKETFHGLSV